ncbi:hypothetical protein VNO80_35192 [Phaseolus coccineus]|uniref:Transmembrane protein n=1 Tax=Phaseolus coccineus TaxID=3886 RepID=A0AAN9Q8M3_PHACN
MLLVSPNRFLVSVNQRHQEREEPLLSVRPVSSFMQFPRPSITRASSQHAHSERKKRSSWIIFLNQNVYKLIPIHSVKVSTAFSRPSTERCRVPLFPVRESPSALTGRARILMSAHAQNSSDTSPSRCAAVRFPASARFFALILLLVSSPTLMNRVCMKGSVKRFGFSVGSRSPAPPHSPLVGRVVNLEGARLLFRRVFDNLAVVWSPLFEAGVLGRWGFLFLNQFGCVSPEIGWSNIYELAGQRWMEVPCCSPLPKAKDGVEPSFQDLQSDTFPLCYPAKPATSCAKVKRLFFLPRSLFFYICGWSTLYDRRRVTREEGTTSFSLAALLHFPFLIESRKPLHYWYRGQKVASSICSGKEHLEASFCLARKSLFRLPSLSPFWLIRFFLRASAWFAPFVLHFFVILRFSLRFSDSRDPTLISYLLKCQLHVLGGPSGRLHADRCLPGEIGAPETRYAVRPLKDSLAPRSIRSEPGLRTFSHRFLSPSHRQQSALIPWCGVKGRVPFLSCPKSGFILIGERLSRGKAKTDCYWLLCLSILLWPAWRHQRKTVISIRDYPRSGEKTECIPIDSKGERRTEWRMEADRLERGLVGREVRFLPDSYLLDPLFPCSCLRLNDTSRKQTTGRTRAGVDAREGTGAEATGIGQRVGRLGKRWLTLICLSTTMVVIIAMACTVACSMVPSLCCWPTTDR